MMNITCYLLSSSYPVIRLDSRFYKAFQGILRLLSIGGQALLWITQKALPATRINTDYPVSSLSTPKGELLNWVAPKGAYQQGHHNNNVILVFILLITLHYILYINY